MVLLDLAEWTTTVYVFSFLFFQEQSRTRMGLVQSVPQEDFQFCFASLGIPQLWSREMQPPLVTTFDE